jgi:hypothetical protein
MEVEEGMVGAFPSRGLEGVVEVLGGEGVGSSAAHQLFQECCQVWLILGQGGVDLGLHFLAGGREDQPKSDPMVVPDIVKASRPGASCLPELRNSAPCPIREEEV